MSAPITLRMGSVGERLPEVYGARIREIFAAVEEGSAAGCEMTGWIGWVTRDHSALIAKAEALRERWRSKGVTTVVLIGTGGSYIGCRGALEFSRPTFGSEGRLNFLYVPYFSERYLRDLLEHLKGLKFAVLVISKSGTTLESAVAFRLVRELLRAKEGAGYAEYVAAVTDGSKGVLRTIADREGFESFVIEDDIGGRYSTLTAVGLVPMVLGGVDAAAVLRGAKAAHAEHFNGRMGPNSPAVYAAFRHMMFRERGLVNECLMCYDPQLKYTLEAMRQLFAESEGKGGMGLMPIIMDLTPDLHSVGQLLQEGHRSFFETTFWVGASAGKPLVVGPSSFGNDDGLDWLAGRSLAQVNGCAFTGTLDAHRDVGEIENLVVELGGWGPEVFGHLYFWASLAAMFSAYLMGVNPFDQPGVETYKGRMFRLLGRP